jgi:hypothetical protein
VNDSLRTLCSLSEASKKASPKASPKPEAKDDDEEEDEGYTLVIKKKKTAAERKKVEATLRGAKFPIEITREKLREVKFVETKLRERKAAVAVEKRHQRHAQRREPKSTTQSQQAQSESLPGARPELLPKWPRPNQPVTACSHCERYTPKG